MNEYQSLNHTKWDCKFHVVWIPKYRKKTLYGQIKKQLGPVFRELANQKESEIVEGRLVGDHVHMLISIPAEVCGCPGDRVYQRQERHMGRTDVRSSEELHRPELLGQRILRLNDWAG